MTTVEEARHSSDDSWTILGKLVTKRVFCTKDKKLMSLTFIDADGILFDIQTWRPNKVYCLYRKMTPNESYIITGRGEFEEPNKEFSTSAYLFKRWWWIEPAVDQLRLKKYVNCSINLNKTIKNLKQGPPENVLGQFVDWAPGPAKYHYNKPYVQGYYVKLLDEEGRLFRVLVWHVTTIKRNKWTLFDAQQGDDVLITCARSSYLNPNAEDEERIYTLTSIVPPVLNSQCVSNRRRQALK